MRWGSPHLLERRGCVDIPEHAQGIWACGFRQFRQQVLIEDADATRFDHDVGVGGFGNDGAQPSPCRRIDFDAGPIRRIDITMLLTIVSVGFIECHLIAAARKIREQAAVIGGRPVPIRRQQA